MNLFDLYAKISLDKDDYEKGLDEASGKTSSFADKLKSGLSTAAKVGGAAITAVAAGVAALTKASVEQYAEYEQLVGGVDTLFKQASDTVQEYAANAYKTAGMSANEYMNTVTSFSASLLQGLGGDTEAAAEVANQAITDMSDNANKMGTSMGMIQNAYQGFAKQNYTMLDNLKLGYGGTQAEMARLINDSGVLGDTMEVTAETVNQVSFDKIIEAIHVVQTEMGITGTTAAEASSTIEGSLNSMKAAWANLVVGIADDNANMDVLITNFVDSTATALGNLLPRISQAISGAGQLIAQLAPVLGEQVPALIVQVLPSLIDAGVQLILGLTQGIMTALPQLAESVPEIVRTIVTALSEGLPQILEMGGQLLDRMVTGIETGLPDMVARLPQIIDNILNFLSQHLPDILDKGVEMLNSLVNGIIGAIPELVAALPQIITSFANFISENLPTFLQTGRDILSNLISGILSVIPDLVSAMPQIINAVVNGIGDLMGSVINIGKDIVRGIWKGIQSMASWIADKVSGFFSSIFGGVKEEEEIHSPSEKWARGIGKPMAQGVGKGFSGEMRNIQREIDDSMGTLSAPSIGQYNVSRQAEPQGQTVINQYIQAVPMTPSELARQSVDAFDRLRWAY